MPAEPPPPWPLTGAFELRNALLAAYGAASRSYHDTRHLREVLARLGELGANGTVFDRLPVELAAWFHDAVYDGQPDAEERSATLARRTLEGIVAPDVVVEVARRTQVLRGLVAKPHLFHTPYARANWETLARANLDHELTTSLSEA